MKPLIRASVILTLFLVGATTTLACSCVSPSLEKRFRKAKAIFVGRHVSDEPQDLSLVQNYSSDNKYSQVVEVIRGFKGTKKKFISITFDHKNLNRGNCPVLFYLEPNKDYLVFAYGNAYEVQNVCSDTWEIPNDKESGGYEQMQGYIKQLGSFWFRFRARWNPF